MLQYVLIGLVCLTAGYWFGGRRGRKVQRQSLQELNTKSLELLESKSKINAIAKTASETERQTRLLNFALEQLKLARARNKSLRQLIITQDKKHFIDESCHRLHAARSHEKAVKATALARKATAHLKRLEIAIPLITSARPAQPNDYHNRILPPIERLGTDNEDAANQRHRLVAKTQRIGITKFARSNRALRPFG